jgi:hypothetical protein
MLTYQDKIRAAIRGYELGSSDWSRMSGDDEHSPVPSDDDERNGNNVVSADEEDDDVLSFTPSMADDMDSASILVVERQHCDSEQEEDNQSAISSVTNDSLAEENTTDPTKENAPDIASSPVAAETSTKTTHERTDTGALLQAGSIAAGILGIGLMLAFGGGAKRESQKEKATTKKKSCT